MMPDEDASVHLAERQIWRGCPSDVARLGWRCLVFTGCANAQRDPSVTTFVPHDQIDAPRIGDHQAAGKRDPLVVVGRARPDNQSISHLVATGVAPPHPDSATPLRRHEDL
jgi:hypothetical protein